jgi:hypothetical protein
VESWISKRIRSVSLRRVAVWTVVLFAGVLLATNDHRYIANFIGGPYTLAPADLDSIQDIEATPRYYARVSAEKVLDTGLREYTVRTRSGVETSRDESAAYHALVMGNRFLVVKTPGAGVNVAEGRLMAWPAGLESQLFDSKEMASLRANFYPFYLDSGPFRRPGYIVIAIAAAFLALFFWQAVPAWRAWRNPEVHPLARRIATWGNPLVVAAEAEHEYQQPYLKAGGGWRLGNKYLVHLGFFGIDVVRVQDLLWAYKKITKHSVNFIPTGKTYEAVVNCYGRTAAIPGKEKGVDQVLLFLQSKAPWAVHGFSDELQLLWTKNQPEFVAAVEERRREGAAAH